MATTDLDDPTDLHGPTAIVDPTPVDSTSAGRRPGPDRSGPDRSGPGRPVWEWTSHEHLTYLASRPVGGRYDPRADYGDPDYREPESDAEADARTAHLRAEREANPPAPAPGSRPLTEAEDALEQAYEDALLADAAHDPNPEAWARARARELEALLELRPVPSLDRGEDEHADDLTDEHTTDGETRSDGAGDRAEEPEWELDEELEP